MMIKSIEDALGINCVDVITRPDGQFTFKVFRKDPEDQGRWSLVADYSGLQFNTEEEAFCAAAAKVPWLAELLASPEVRQGKGFPACGQ
jgi:hypothetical protein